jgi:hypothetical protein
MRYVGTIFVTGAGLWLLFTIGMFIRPPSYAGLCGEPAGMCCVSCAVFGWFTIVPMFGFLLALILFLPGHLLVLWTARRAVWWRAVYWLPGWLVTGMIAAVLFCGATAFTDRKIIALNINNGILTEMAWQGVEFAIIFAIFGLLCGACYWMMFMRAARPARTRARRIG